MMIFFYWTSTVVCEYACTRVITLVSSIYHVSLYLIKENPYYNWYPVIVLWNHLGWLSWIILAHKSTSLRIYIQAFVKCLLELYRYCYQLTKLRPNEPGTFLLPNDSTVFYEDWCVMYLANTNKYWNSGVILNDDSFSFWSFFYAYIMLIGLDVTMANRKSIFFIFRKQCNESKKIQRDVITEDIHWCALNVSRLSNGNL